MEHAFNRSVLLLLFGSLHTGIQQDRGEAFNQQVHLAVAQGNGGNNTRNVDTTSITLFKPGEQFRELHVFAQVMEKDGTFGERREHAVALVKTRKAHNVKRLALGIGKGTNTACRGA